MSTDSREDFWTEHQDTLQRIRSNLSGRQSKTKSRTPLTGGRISNHRSKHPPYGKYRRSTSPNLPRLYTPPEHDERRSKRNLRSRYEQVPPLKPRKAFEQQDNYDSWGEESGNEDSSDRPDPFPYPMYAPPTVVYGQPFPMYYPPPPKGSLRYQRRRDKKRRSDEVNYLKLYDADHRDNGYAKRKGRRSRHDRHSVAGHRYPGPSGGYPMHMLNPYLVPVHTVVESGEEPDDRDDYRRPSTKTPPRRIYHDIAPVPRITYKKDDPYSFYVNHPLFADDFVNWFLTDCLEEELVPDVLIEALQELDKLPAEHPYFMPALKACDDFLTHEVERMTDEIVRETLTEVARQHPVTPPPYVPLRDPLQDFLDEMVSNTVNSLCREMVGETIRGLAHNYLEDVTNENILNDLIADEIHDIRHELLDDVMFEMIAGEFLEEHVIGPEIEEESMVIAKDMIKYYDSKITRREMRAVKVKSEDRLTDSLCLNYLLSLIARQGKVWTQSDYANKFLDEIMGNILLQQYFNVRSDKEKTTNCKPLRKLHQKVVTDVALEVLLQQLSASLDEDLADVDEYERGVNDGIELPTAPAIIR